MTPVLPQIPPPVQAVNPSPSLDMGETSAALDPKSPNYGTSIAYLVPNWVTLTDAIYAASKAPALQSVLKMVPGPARFNAAAALVALGYVVDMWCDAEGSQSPTVTMLERSEYGLFKVAPMGQASPQPTPAQPIMQYSGPNPINVSIDASDYPPYPVPAVPVNTGAVSGFAYALADGTRVFSATPAGLAMAAAGTLKNGVAFVENGVGYIPQISLGLMGETVLFTIPPMAA